MTDNETILLVDDDENDLRLMQLAFKWAHLNSPVQVIHNGAQAIAYLKGEGPYADRVLYPLPAVVLLDLKMPTKDGFEVLRWVRAQPVFKSLAIIILTASSRSEDVEKSFALGANSYLVKPPTVDELIAMMRCLRDWLKINSFAVIKDEHTPPRRRPVHSVTPEAPTVALAK